MSDSSSAGALQDGLARERRIAVDGAMLHVRADGPLEAPCVVLMGSLAADTRLWDEQISALVGYRVLRYDYRGHGRSIAQRAGQPMPTLLADLLAVLDAHDVEDATLVGLSLGGMIAMEAALAHPQRFRAIVVAAALADMPEALGAGWSERARQVRVHGVESIADETLSRWLTPSFAARKPSRWSALREMICSTTPEGYAGCIEAIRDIRLLSRLPSLASRALFIVGDADSASTPERMEEMARRVKDSRFEVLAGAAHLPNVEQAGAFNGVLLSFLEASGRVDARHPTPL